MDKLAKNDCVQLLFPPRIHARSIKDKGFFLALNSENVYSGESCSYLPLWSKEDIFEFTPISLELSNKCLYEAIDLTAIFMSIHSSFLNWELRSENIFYNTNPIPPSPFNPIDEKTISFLKDHNFMEAVHNLKTLTTNFFPNSNFKLELLSVEDGDGIENRIGLCVYGGFSTKEFSEKRFSIFETMTQQGYKVFCEFLSIFQRRTSSYGWQEISLYREAIAA